MDIYKVGGFVRDTLMGLEAKDCDYVVVGATPEDMQALGYEQVGKDFPVFLHPKTGDEYALARTERKTGLGYGGFEVDTKGVTLEEDLFRRDLTINAMAFAKDGTLIDPYHGKKDLENGILRHVSVHFKEDPVRILRIARFSARYNFDIAPQTLDMMREMVENGEFDNLTGERVWKEFEKVLSEKHLQNFFKALDFIGALQRVPGFSSVREQDFFTTINEQHSAHAFDLNLVHVFSNMSKNDLKKWKMPAECMQKIAQYSSWKDKSGFYSEMSLEDKLSFIQQNKGLHQPENIANTLYLICAYQAWVENRAFAFDYEQEMLLTDIHKLKQLNYEEIVKDALSQKQKPNEVVKQAQLQALTQVRKMKP